MPDASVIGAWNTTRDDIISRGTRQTSPEKRFSERWDRLGHGDPEAVADILYAELDALEVEAVWEQAGQKRHGYVEPADDAYHKVEEVLEPFPDELRTYQRLGMSVEAVQLCSGLLMGLSKFERELTSEFNDWAVDAPISVAAEVVETWRTGEPSRTVVVTLKGLVEEKLGEWGQGLL